MYKINHAQISPGTRWLLYQLTIYNHLKGLDVTKGVTVYLQTTALHLRMVHALKALQ